MQILTTLSLLFFLIHSFQNVQNIDNFPHTHFTRDDFGSASVSSAGDFNNDGFEDILIGIPSATGQFPTSGISILLFGSNSSNFGSINISSISQINGITFNGMDSTDYAGFSVSSAGDFNNDGFDDILISASEADPNGNLRAGETYLIFGTNQSFGSQFNLSSINGTNGIIFNGIDSDDRSGWSVSCAGDFNNDGFTDILIGARRASPNGNSQAGETYLIFGTNQPFSPQFNLSSLNGTNGIIFNGIDANDYSGNSVSSAGDFNNDGFDDILIGAYVADPNGNGNAGETYLIFGTNQSFSSEFNLSSINGTNGIIFNGIDVNDISGSSVSSAGDFNNDGFDDILISSGFVEVNGSPAAGETYLIFGTNQSLGSQFNLSSLDGANGIIFYGIIALEYSGYSVSSSGDFNNDGFDDILIGAFGGDSTGNDNVGKIHIVFGTNETLSSPFSIDATNSTQLMTLIGTIPFGEIGKKVSSGGDFNNDGFGDVIVSSITSSVYVVYGQYICANGFTGQNCVACPKPSIGSQYNSTFCDLTSFSCSVNNFHFFSQATNAFTCISCPSDTSLGTYFTDGQTTKCEFELTGKCGSGEYLEITTGTNFDSYNCRSCQDSAMNSLPSTKTSCSCVEGSIYNGDSCVLATESFNSSIVGLSLFSLSFCGFAGVFYFFKYHSKKIADSSDPNQSFDASFIPFEQWKPVLNPSILDIFQTLSLFIWTPQMVEFENSQYLSKSQVFAALSYLKSTPYIPGSVTHLDLASILRLGIPYLTFFQVCGMLFLIQIPWSLSLVYGKSVLPLFLFYFGAENYIASVAVSICFGFLGLLLSHKPQLIGTIVHLFTIPLLFSYLSVFNCVSVPNGFYGINSSQEYVFFSLGENSLQCWSNEHIILVCLSIVMLILFTTLIIYHKIEIATQHWFKLFVVVAFLFFSTPSIVAPYLQLIILLSFSIFSIVYALKYVDKSYERYFQLLSQILFCFLLLIGFIALFINNSNNLTSGTLLLLTSILFVLFGLPSIEQLWYQQLFSKFFNLNKAPPTTSESPSNKLSVSSTLSILLLIGLCLSLPLDKLGSDGIIFKGIEANDWSGWSVSSAGDFNNDGFDDILISANQASPNGNSKAGESYLIFGSNQSLGSQFNISSLNGTNGIIFNGIDAGDWSGTSISSAGDFNNDGFDDILIGAYLADPNAINQAGETYLIFGTNQSLGSQFNLSSINGTNGIIFNGVDMNDWSGYSVSSAGDFNNDDFDDILIGAYKATSNGNPQAGETYLIFGTNQPFSPQFNLSSLNGTNGIIFNAIDANDFSGNSISSAGDFNNDGFVDILIGANAADPNGDSNAGETYLIFGTNQSFGSQFNLSSINGTNGIIFNGIDPNDNSGFSVSSAGDFNNDGFDDILISATYADPNGNTNAGETYLVFGTNQAFSSQFNLSSINGTNGIIFNGIDTNDYSGNSVSSAGDFNNDGFADILIGSSQASSYGLTENGFSYVVFGSNLIFESPFNLSSLDGTNGFFSHGYQSSSYCGSSVSSTGDFNNDGIADILVSCRDSVGETMLIKGSSTKFCPAGSRFDVPTQSCVLCVSSKIGPQNINESRTLSCSISLDWDSYLSCSENQVINITNNPVGSCIDCVPFPGVTYLSTKFECNPQCEAFHRLENSFGNLSCVACPEGQNPEVNNYPECACRGENLNEHNKCLPFARFTGTVDPGTLGYFSGIGGILLFLGFFVYRKQTSQTKISNKNLHFDSLQVFIDTRNDYSTEDFESLFRYLFDYVFCSLSLLPRMNSVKNDDNSNDDNSVELPEIDREVKNVDILESNQEIAKIRNYFLQFPILPGAKPFYSKQDKILLAKIFIEFAQFIGLLSGLSIIQTNFGGSSFALFIFSIFNFDFGSLNFIVIFWIVNFFVFVWALILIANWKPSLPLANLLQSISHRLIPLLGGIFVIPIVSTLFKAFICLEIEDPDGKVRLYVSATVDNVDSEDKLQCYTETHTILMVFSCLSLLTYLPSLIFNIDFVEKLIRSQFIHKLDFVKVNVLLKISASAITIFIGTSTDSIVLQSLSALFVFLIFIILAVYTWKTRPCLTFDKVNSYRVSMNLTSIFPNDSYVNFYNDVPITHARQIIPCDLDGNGIPDLVFTGANTRLSYILFNPGVLPSGNIFLNESVVSWPVPGTILDFGPSFNPFDPSMNPATCIPTFQGAGIVGSDIVYISSQSVNPTITIISASPEWATLPMNRIHGDNLEYSLSFLFDVSYASLLEPNSRVFNIGKPQKSLLFRTNASDTLAGYVPGPAFPPTRNGIMDWTALDEDVRFRVQATPMIGEITGALENEQAASLQIVASDGITGSIFNCPDPVNDRLKDNIVLCDLLNSVPVASTVDLFYPPLVQQLLPRPSIIFANNVNDISHRRIDFPDFGFTNFKATYTGGLDWSSSQFASGDINGDFTPDIFMSDPMNQTIYVGYGVSTFYLDNVTSYSGTSFIPNYSLNGDLGYTIQNVPGVNMLVLGDFTGDSISDFFVPQNINPFGLLFSGAPHCAQGYYSPDQRECILCPFDINGPINVDGGNFVCDTTPQNCSSTQYVQSPLFSCLDCPTSPSTVGYWKNSVNTRDFCNFKFNDTCPAGSFMEAYTTSLGSTVYYECDLCPTPIFWQGQFNANASQSTTCTFELFGNCSAGFYVAETIHNDTRFAEKYCQPCEPDDQLGGYNLQPSQSPICTYQLFPNSSCSSGQFLFTSTQCSATSSTTLSCEDCPPDTDLGTFNPQNSTLPTCVLNLHSSATCPAKHYIDQYTNSQGYLDYKCSKCPEDTEKTMYNPFENSEHSCVAHSCSEGNEAQIEGDKFSCAKVNNPYESAVYAAALGTTSLGGFFFFALRRAKSKMKVEYRDIEIDSTLLGTASALGGAVLLSGDRTQPVVNVLTLDGGGIRGLFHIWFLQKLQSELFPLQSSQYDISNCFHLIAGTSTGGLVALGLLDRNQNLEGMETMYMTLGQRIFAGANTRMGRLVKHLSGRSLYSSKNFEKILSSVFEEQILEHDSTNHKKNFPKILTVSTLSSVSPPKEYLFRSYHVEDERYLHPSPEDSWMLWEVARATSAAPTFFDEYVKGGELYADGALFHNNPSRMAHREVLTLWPKATYGVFISLGTGKTNQKNAEKSKSAFAWVQAITEIATDSERCHHDMSELVDAEAYFRFSPNLPTQIPLDASSSEDLDMLKVYSDAHHSTPGFVGSYDQCITRLKDTWSVLNPPINRKLFGDDSIDNTSSSLAHDLPSQIEFLKKKLRQVSDDNTKLRAIVASSERVTLSSSSSQKLNDSLERKNSGLKFFNRKNSSSSSSSSLSKNLPVRSGSTLKFTST